MTYLTLERLSIPKPPPEGKKPRGLGHWGGRDPQEVADLVRAATIGQGVALPVAHISDGLVSAVVEWDMDVLAERLRRGQAPVLYRSVIHDRLTHGSDHEVPSPLRVLGYVGLGAFPRSRRTLARLSGMSRAIAAVPDPPGVDDWQAAQCNYYGYTVATVNAAEARVVVEGLPHGKGEHRGIAGHHFRLRQEQLFDVALRTETTPLPWSHPAE